MRRELAALALETVAIGVGSSFPWTVGWAMTVTPASIKGSSTLRRLWVRGMAFGAFRVPLSQDPLSRRCEPLRRTVGSRQPWCAPVA